MFTVDNLLIVTGVLLALITLLNLLDGSNAKRFTTAAFWGLYALSYLIGDKLDPRIVGIGVILMAVIAGFNGMGLGSYDQLGTAERKASSVKLGNWLFVPILIFAFTALIGPFVLAKISLLGLPLIDPKNETVGSLGLGCLIALIAAMFITRDTPVRAIKEGRRLIDMMGWPLVLPQLLATLGALFTAAGVGKAIAYVVASNVPVSIPFAVVAAYAIGMALFTMIMGNAFAAFPILTAGIGLPFLINMHHGDAAVMAAIGMFSGYCGTLMTPMAANFNTLPVALLEIPDKYAVIKAQIPTALPLLLVNIVLMYFLMFR